VRDRERRDALTIREQWERVHERLRQDLPKLVQLYQEKEPQRLEQLLLQLLWRAPGLKGCTIDSVFQQIFVAAQMRLSLDPILGQAYLVPFESREKHAHYCQLILGYKGILELARRSAEIRNIEAHVVYEKDKFFYELGMHPKLKHVPSLSADRGQPIAAYAIAWLTSGATPFVVLTKAEIDKYQRLSRSSSSAYSPWHDHWDAMAKKTALRRLAPWLPLSVEDRRVIFKEEIWDMTGATPLEDEAAAEEAETNAPTTQVPTRSKRLAFVAEVVQAQKQALQGAEDAATEEAPVEQQAQPSEATQTAEPEAMPDTHQHTVSSEQTPRDLLRSDADIPF